MIHALSRAGSATSEARAVTLQAASMRSGLEEKLRCKTQEINQLKEEIRLLIEESQNAHVKEVDKQYAQLSALNHLLKQQHSRLKSDFDKTETEKAKLSKAVLKLLIKMSSASNYVKYVPTNMNEIICRANKNVEKLTFQVELLKSNPAAFNIECANQNSLPTEYVIGKQISRVDCLQKALNIDKRE
ncbi:hypothetical protein FBUS_06188 [Fasciolopsis buskii]|uniref:Uncharacterized protein n=1 Tax=Fasciolopsis buskii TaxID=27845 RepID=A0A8E0VPD9_9TREM|nr:hypothetical protein FBUS_06188 [Fasciolopsis buski]